MGEIEDSRFEIIKKMLDEFPQLREKVRKWLKETEFPKKILKE